MDKQKDNPDVLLLLNRVFLLLFVFSTLTLMFLLYVVNQPHHPTLFYIAVTSSGLWLLTYILKCYFMPLKILDLDYFRNIIVGISGGIAVWILSSMNYSSFKTDFWLSVNNLIIKLGISVFIILIGYVICKKDTKTN